MDPTAATIYRKVYLDLVFIWKPGSADAGWYVGYFNPLYICPHRFYINLRVNDNIHNSYHTKEIARVSSKDSALRLSFAKADILCCWLSTVQFHDYDYHYSTNHQTRNNFTNISQRKFIDWLMVRVAQFTTIISILKFKFLLTS